MLNGPLFGKIIMFALPIALSSMLQQMFNSADSAVIGRFADTNALAAVGTNAETVGLMVSISAGLAVGANVSAAMLIGRRQSDNLPKVAVTSLLFAFSFGLLLTIIGQFAVRPLLTVMSTPSNIIDQADMYLRIYLLSLPFLQLYDFGAALLRAKGDSTRPFMILIASGVIKVLLNLFFVVVLKLSVAGVALATDIANVFSAFCVVMLALSDYLRAAKAAEEPAEKAAAGVSTASRPLSSNTGTVSADIYESNIETDSAVHAGSASGSDKNKENMNGISTDHGLIKSLINTYFDKSILLTVVHIGVPAALQGAVFCIANLFVQTSVNGFGSVVVAGSTIGVNLEYFSYYMLAAFGQTATTFVGQNYAAGSMKRCKRVFALSLVSALVFSGSIVGIMYLNIEAVCSFFTKDSEVLQIALLRTSYIFALEWMCSLFEVPAGVLRGSGHSSLPAVISVVFTCCLRIVWIYTIFSHLGTLQSLFVVYPVSWLVTSLVMFIAYFVLHPFREGKL